MDLIERFRGSLLGLAAGDALGTTAEFQMPGTFTTITTMTGGGVFNLLPGQWTDDTSMALCLAESLIECQGFDPADQMRRYCRWKNEGHLSSTGTCFDIGATVGEALRHFERTGDPYSGSFDPYSAGNGSLMRLAPIPLFFASDPQLAIERAADSSRTTHAAPEAVDACRYMAALIVGALQGKSKEELLNDMFEPVPGIWEERPLVSKVRTIAAGSFKANSLPTPSGTGGYVIPSLEIALWSFYQTNNFRDGALLAVNLGLDADTYGAIYGQLAGAYYGESGIPQEWLSLLAQRDMLESLASKLYEFRTGNQQN